MLSGRLCRLSPTFSFHPKTGLVVPVAAPHELGIFLELAALRGHIAAAIADLAVIVTIHEAGV